MQVPTINSKLLPLITTEQMIEVDRLMIEKYQIELIQMMENAGRCLAILAKARYHSVINKEIIILAGTGGNGGGALVCARRLISWGYKVKVFLTSQEKITKIPKHQLRILHNMDANILEIEDLKELKVNEGLIIDGIIGYSIKGNPRGNAEKMINWANAQKAPILALDTPSGINLTSGKVFPTTISADATLTLALPKKGLFNKEVINKRGTLYLGDISVPPQLYSEPSLDIQVGPFFKNGDLLKID